MTLFHNIKQVATHKSQAHRIKVLSLTSDSDTDSDKKARYQDLHHPQLLKYQ